jgi:polyhydroxybutyrate depolymerase
MRHERRRQGPARGRPRRRVALGSAVMVAALVTLTACGSSEPTAAPPSPAVRHGALTVDGRVRTYRVFVPTTLEAESRPPLVLVLGGVGNSAENMVSATEFDRQGSVGNFIAAYPEGLDLTWNAGFCCASGTTSGVDDVAFLSQLIHRLVADHDADPERVYAAGVSAGAMMAYRLACELPGQIAGVGSVAGAMVLDRCQPDHGVPVIEIHGTDDQLVPYEGGPVRPEGVATQPAPSTLAVAERWAALNGCPAAPDEETDGLVTTLSWTGCPDGAAVKLVAVEGGGHTWFATGLGPANGAVDATTLIWDFFSSGQGDT